MLKDRPLSIALVQSENEVLHTPAYDLSAFLASDPKTWDLQLFTDRNFEGLIETAGQYDCLVLGFNVLHLTRELVETLEASLPDTGILVLHQLTGKALSFLPPDLRVKVERFPDTEERVVLPIQVKPDDEILFRWPACVETTRGAVDDTSAETQELEGSTICYLEEAVAKRWRRFLEVEHGNQRRAVAIRTLRTRRPGIILCNVWLEPSRKDHAALLTNMIRYCARGIPDVAVLTPERDARLDVLARKVSLQGIRVVQLEDDWTEGSPFARWPLKRIQRAVTTEDAEVDEDWQSRGGTIVRVSDSGELSLSGGQSDQLWVTTCWAAWFSDLPTQVWHAGKIEGEKEPRRGSIFQSRAILRMLDWIEHQPAESVGTLSLQSPRSYAPYLGALIGPRLNADGGVDGTISSTAAAWDINELTGRKALTKKTVGQMEKWLRKRFKVAPYMSMADRLDIARALRDPALLEESLVWLRARTGSSDAFTPPGARLLPSGAIALSPMIVTRLRQTCVAVSDARGSMDLPALLKDIEEDHDAGLSTNLLLAAEHVEAAMAFESAFGKEYPTVLNPNVGDQAVANLELAIGTLSRHGRVVHIGEAEDGWDPESINGESISTEALSLIAYFGRQPSDSVAAGKPITNTHFISPRSRGLPAIAVNQLISEVQEARQAFAEASTTNQTQERSLVKARHILGVITLITAIVATWRWVVFDKGARWDEAIGAVVGVAILSAVIVIARLILAKWGLAPEWLTRPAEAALESSGPLKPILSAMQRKKPDPPPNA